jgi:catechol 2,3-dioxygenase-like lactoylglutathione lyase family enzyme
VARSKNPARARAFLEFLASAEAVPAIRKSGLEAVRASQAFKGLAPYLVAISVKNVDDSASWYRRVMDLRLVDAKSFPDRGLRIAFLESDAFRLELVELRDSVSPAKFAPDPTNPASVQGVGKYAFRVDHLDEVVASLNATATPIFLDFTKAPVATDRSVIVRDNDGNWIQFFQRLP